MNRAFGAGLLLALSGAALAAAPYLVVLLFGAMVGFAELVSRYRDAPLRAIRTRPAFAYILLNGLASAGALGVVRAFGWTFGLEPSNADRILLVQILVAGFGAMALFRSSLFTMRVGEEDVNVGPHGFLQLILDASDRGVDRERAEARSTEVARAMSEISFDRSHIALPALCLALMQNLPERDQAALGDEVKKLRESPAYDDPTKSLLLGLTLMNVVGHAVLLAAIKSLDPYVRRARRLECAQQPLSLVAGEEMSVPLQVTGSGGEALPSTSVQWKSGNESVVRLSAPGRLAAVAPGEALVSASVDGVVLEIAVKVA